MTRSEAKRALERAEAVYYAEIARIADAVRTRYVVPYCDRTGASFCAGMGSWGFTPKDEKSERFGSWHLGQTAEDAPGTARICKALDLRDIRGQDLGSQMEDYNR